MAVEEDGTKSDTEEVEDKPKKKKPWLLIGIITFLVIVLIGGAAVGALFYAGMFDTKEQQKNAVAQVDENGEIIENKEEDAEDSDATDDEEEVDEEEDDEEVTEEQKKKAIYVPIESTFVVNFEGVSKVRFLQVTVELMTRDEAVVDAIKTHMPVIRNNLTFLFSSRSFEDVSTVAGKEQLRASALDEVQKIMENETNNPSVEALYFTSFVTQ